MKISAVIFDRDNTLVQLDMARLATIQEHIALIAPDLPPDAALRFWEGWPGPWPRHPADEPSFWRGFWSAFGREYALQNHQIVILREEIGPIYHTIFSAYADTLPCLLALRQAGLRLAVLTNFELPSIDRTLAHAGLDPELFEVTLSSAAIGVHKPDPRAFLAAAAALDLPPAACMLIDDLRENVEAARSIGIEALQIDRSRAADDPASSVIATLASLPRLLFSSSSTSECSV